MAALDLHLASPHNISHRAEELSIHSPCRRLTIPMGAEVGRGVEVLHPSQDLHVGRGCSCKQKAICVRFGMLSARGCEMLRYNYNRKIHSRNTFEKIYVDAHHRE
jgi:hypothetical protein